MTEWADEEAGLEAVEKVVDSLDDIYALQDPLVETDVLRDILRDDRLHMLLQVRVVLWRRRIVCGPQIKLKWPLNGSPAIRPYKLHGDVAFTNAAGRCGVPVPGCGGRYPQRNWPQTGTREGVRSSAAVFAAHAG